MAGKNKIETGLRFFYDDSSGAAQNITCDMVPGSLSVNGFTYEEIGMTGVCDAVDNFLAGRASLDVAAQFYMNDTATTGAFTVLNGQAGRNSSTGDLTMTIQFGSGGAAPTSGDPELEGEFVLLALPISMNGGKAIMSPAWKPATSTAPAWGTV